MVSTKNIKKNNVVFNIDNNVLSPDQQIRMISEGSYDTEDWSNACWKFSFAIIGINYILKYI